MVSTTPHAAIWVFTTLDRGIFHNVISGIIIVWFYIVFDVTVWLCMDGRSYPRHWDD